MEIHNGSGHALKQHVWAPGSRYIDELVQVMLAPRPGANRKPHVPFWVMQDANYNVIGLLSRTGRLVERYTYTPYGQRTVYSHGYLAADFNDDGDVDGDDSNVWGGSFPMASGATIDDGDADGDGDVDGDDYNIWGGQDGESVVIADDPLLNTPASFSYRESVNDNPAGMCEFGHQGLMHDESLGIVDNRHRIWIPPLGRFAQTDPIGYPDGLNTYAGYHVMWGGVDPTGLSNELLATDAHREKCENRHNRMYRNVASQWKFLVAGMDMLRSTGRVKATAEQEFRELESDLIALMSFHYWMRHCGCQAKSCATRTSQLNNAERLAEGYDTLNELISRTNRSDMDPTMALSSASSMIKKLIKLSTDLVANDIEYGNVPLVNPSSRKARELIRGLREQKHLNRPFKRWHELIDVDWGETKKALTHPIFEMFGLAHLGVIMDPNLKVGECRTFK